MAYERLEPFGPPAANLNAGIIASTIANVNRSKDSRAIKAEEMALGDFGVAAERRGTKEQTVEQQKAILMGLAKSTHHKAKREGHWRPSAP